VFQDHGSGLRHQNHGRDPKIQIHRNRSRYLGPPQITSNRGTTQKVNQSTGTKLQQNFAKSTIHIKIIGWPVTAPSPWVWSRSTNTEQIHRHRMDPHHATQPPSGPKIQITCRSHSEVLNKAQEENFAKSTIHIARSSARLPEVQIHG
jgi:mitochondrial fission protein ELM1